MPKEKFNAHSNQQFGKSLLGDDLLDRAVEYIKDNMHPDDIFSDEELGEWASENGFVPVAP